MHSRKLKFVPDEEQLSALEFFRALYGKCWKSEIRKIWMRDESFPKFNNVMRHIRNSAGPTWLQRFSIDKAIEKRKVAPVYCSIDISCNNDSFQGDSGAHKLAQVIMKAVDHLRVYSDLKKLEFGFQHTLLDENGNTCGVLRISRKERG
jgi:hypothetical protein